MDIVICVAYKNCFFLKKNILFINKNLSPDNIYVIINRSNFSLLEGIADNVKPLDENKLVDGLNFSAVRNVLKAHLGINLVGWYFQQFLKMGFALTSFAKEDYLVWDADTVPLNHLAFKDNPGHYLFMPKTEHHEPYFRTIDKLFDAPKKADYSFISEHMIFNVKIMRELIAKIGQAEISGHSSGALWFEKCIYAIQPGVLQGFSEFETYGTYCLNYYPDIFRLRKFRTFRRGGLIFGMMASTKEIDSLKDDLDTCSFELYDYPVSLHRRWLQKAFYWYCRIKNKLRTK